MVLKPGHFGKQIRNTWEVLRSGAGTGWRWWVGPIAWKTKNITYSKWWGQEYPTYSKKKANWIGHILRKNCLLQHVIKGKIEGRAWVPGRRGRRRKRLLDDLKEKGGYWKLKEEALCRILWRTRFGRGYGPVVRHYRMNRKAFQGH
jgi:hypothetical protein